MQYSQDDDLEEDSQNFDETSVKQEHENESKQESEQDSDFLDSEDENIRTDQKLPQKPSNPSVLTSDASFTFKKDLFKKGNPFTVMASND